MVGDRITDISYAKFVLTPLYFFLLVRLLFFLRVPPGIGSETNIRGAAGNASAATGAAAGNACGTNGDTNRPLSGVGGRAVTGVNENIKLPNLSFGRPCWRGCLSNSKICPLISISLNGYWFDCSSIIPLSR